MGKFFKNIWTGIKKAFGWAGKTVKKYAPVAISVCEKLKDAVENNTYDTVGAIVGAAIPGKVDDIAIAKLKIYLENNLPKIIASLQLGNVLAGSEHKNVDEQLKIVLDSLRISEDETKANTYRDVASKLFDYMSDGKFTKAERREFIDWYYEKYVKTTK